MVFSAAQMPVETARPIIRSRIAAIGMKPGAVHLRTSRARNTQAIAAINAQPKVAPGAKVQIDLYPRMFGQDAPGFGTRVSAAPSAAKALSASRAGYAGP